MAHDAKFGALIDEHQQRDAIHVAIAPVVAAERLYPGDHVGFCGEDTTLVGKTLPGITPIGIIDPFLRGRVEPGERCWLLLYQQTITSLRHEWTHPAFAAGGSEKTKSEAWLRAYADKAGVSYGALLDAARDKNHGGDGHRLPSDIPNAVYVDDAGVDILAVMWKHYEIVTGDKVSDPEAGPFWCSC